MRARGLYTDQKGQQKLHIIDRWRTVAPLSATPPFYSVGPNRRTTEFEDFARSCNENNRFSSLPMRILPAGTHSFTARNQPGGMNFYSKAHLAIKQLLGENMRQKPPTSHVQKVMVHPQIAYMHKKISAVMPLRYEKAPRKQLCLLESGYALGVRSPGCHRSDARICRERGGDQLFSSPHRRWPARARAPRGPAPPRARTSGQAAGRRGASAAPRPPPRPPPRRREWPASTRPRRSRSC